MIRKAPTFAEAPAFPSALGSGVSMRDLFAMVAMHGIVLAVEKNVVAATDAFLDDYQQVAEEAYGVADAMLAARSTKEEK